MRLWGSDKTLSWVSRVIRARWWCCGKGSQLRYERRLSANQARKRRCERNFPVARVRSVQKWPQHTTDTKLWELSMCTQCLSCLKSKYLWFFSSRGVSRDPGTDNIELAIANSVCSAWRYSLHRWSGGWDVHFRRCLLRIRVRIMRRGLLLMLGFQIHADRCFG